LSDLNFSPQHKQVSSSDETDLFTGTAGCHFCGSASAAIGGIEPEVPLKALFT
jgi:hypothetical protein